MCCVSLQSEFAGRVKRQKRMGPCAHSNEQLKHAFAEMRRVKPDREHRLMGQITEALRVIDTPHHCCLACGFTPGEGMEKFLQIHGPQRTMFGLKEPLGGPDLDHVRTILKGEY